MQKSPSHQDEERDSKKTHLIAHHRELMSSWHNAQDVFTRLCRRLHISLELDQCLSVFLEELRSIMAFNSFTYQHEQGRDSYLYTEGYGGQHRCEYNLSLQGEHFGHLVLHRRSRFADEELAVLEQLIGVLVFPLRNCWRHRAAWDAALTDPVTLLGNRRALLDAMERTMRLSSRHQEDLSLVLCDLDHFKQINDGYGHVFGDEVLAEVARVLRQVIRISDEAFRYGGEEFAILLPHTSLEEALVVAERIRSALGDRRLLCDGKTVRVTTSAGVAERGNHREAGAFIDAADAALYAAKEAGRNRVAPADDTSIPQESMD